MLRNVLRCGVSAAWVVLLLAGCGGGDSEGPVALPQSMDLQIAQQVEAGAEFTAMAEPAGGPDVSYRWDFGDGSSSSQRAPTHRYLQPGDYDVTLTVSGAGATSRIFKASAPVQVRHYANVQGTVCSRGAGTGWCWQRPQPSGNAAAAVTAVDAATAWAVGERGLVLKTTDGGANWMAQDAGVATNLSAAAFADPQTGWVVGADSTVLRTTDGGNTWSAQVLPVPGVALQRIWVLSRDAAVIGTGYSGYYGYDQLFVTFDAGATWVVRAGQPVQAVSGGALWSLQSTYTSGDALQVRRSVDLGANWVSASLPGSTYWTSGTATMAVADALNAMVVSWIYKTPGEVYASSAAIWITGDGGQTWSLNAPAELAGQTTVQKAELLPGGQGWLLSNNRNLWRTTDGGQSWVSISLPAALAAQYLSSFQVFDATTVAIPSATGVHLTTDGGVSWRFLGAAEQRGVAYASYGVASLKIVDDQHHWLQYGARFYRSNDAGVTFDRVLGSALIDAGATTLAAWFFDGREGLALSSTGWLERTTDGGRTWTASALSVGSTVGAATMQFTSREVGWLLLRGQSVFMQTVDGGRTWLRASISDAGALADFHFIDGQQGWALDAVGRVFRTADGGLSWGLQGDTSLGHMYGVATIRFSDPNHGVAGGYGGNIRYTSDGGRTWHASLSRTYGTVMKLRLLDTQRGWALVDGSTVLRTQDGGRTWSQAVLPALSYYQSFKDIHFLDDRSGWIVGTGGTLLSTTDGGLSWTLHQTGSGISLTTVIFSDPYTGWLFGTDGAVLATATGG